VTDAVGLAGARRSDKPVLGLFSSMSLEWNGPTAKLEDPATGDYGPAVRCTETQRPANEPSLADMTTKAISLLEGRDRRHGDGFFLVEGASVHKRDHAANPCQQIGETVAFDQGIGVALDDHGRTWTRSSCSPRTTATRARSWPRTPNGTNGPTGYAENLLTKDGQKLRISYGTAGG
jgi:alkaline phosphatase/streptomycin-6-phosphatase